MNLINITRVILYSILLLFMAVANIKPAISSEIGIQIMQTKWITTFSEGKCIAKTFYINANVEVKIIYLIEGDTFLVQLSSNEWNFNNKLFNTYKKAKIKFNNLEQSIDGTFFIIDTNRIEISIKKHHIILFNAVPTTYIIDVVGKKFIFESEELESVINDLEICGQLR